MLTSTAIGRAGEYLAASAIELQGWGVSPASLQYIDLLAVRESCVLKVQVKATLSRDRENRYHFNIASRRQGRIAPQNVDVVAFVMLDTRRVYFRSATGLRATFVVNNTMLALEDIEQESWNAALGQCAAVQSKVD